jgi:hypothetical protein
MASEGADYHQLEPVETFPFFAASREAIPLGLLLQKVREGRV